MAWNISSNPQTSIPKVFVPYRDEWKGWEQIRHRLQKGVVLKDIRWGKEIQGTDFRIDIEIHFISHTQFTMDHDKHVLPLTLPFVNYHLEPPFRLFIVACNDIDTYKEDVRNKLRQWIAPLQEREMEYLILYVNNQAKKSGTLSLLTRSVLHSLHNDFKSKIDRICVVKTEQDSNADEEQWRDVWNKMTDAIARHYTRTVESFSREIKKLDSERSLPGWNFCKFFIVKEGLALMYERLHMYNEALILYDELEIAFLELEREKKSLVMGTFGGTDYGDDSGSILNDYKKAYRRSLANNTITEFDFRQYLFARQCRLLLVLQRLEDVAERSYTFIRSFVKELTAHKFSKRFIAVWSFSAYCDLAETLRSHLLLAQNPNSPFSKSSHHSLEYFLPLFHYNARLMLDRLGIEKKWLPSPSEVFVFTPLALQHSDQTPYIFLVTLPKDDQQDEGSLPTASSSHIPEKIESKPSNVNMKYDPTRDDFPITHPSLVAALNSPPAFYKLYTTLTNRAIEYYKKINRFRTVFRLELDLALLDLCCGRYAMCADQLNNLWSFLYTNNLPSSISESYGATSLSGVDGFWPIHFEIQHRLAFLNWLLKRTEAYAHSLWYLLSPSLVSLLPGALGRLQNGTSYTVSELYNFYFSELQALSPPSPLSSFNLPLSHYTALQIDTIILSSQNDELHETFKKHTITCRDTIQFCVIVYSHLLQSIKLDEVCVKIIHKIPKLSTSDTIERRLSSVIICPGRTCFKIPFKPERIGNYHVNCVTITSGSMKWVFSPSKSENPIVECVRSTPKANLFHHNEFPLIAGNWQYLQIVIQTNEDCLNNATLTFTSSALTNVECVPPEPPSIHTNGLCIPRSCSLEPIQLNLCDNVIPLPSSIGTNETLQINIPVFSPSHYSFDLIFHLKYCEGSSKEKFDLKYHAEKIQFIEPWSSFFEILNIEDRSRNSVLICGTMKLLLPYSVRIEKCWCQGISDIINPNNVLHGQCINPNESIMVLYEAPWPSTQSLMEVGLDYTILEGPTSNSLKNVNQPLTLSWRKMIELKDQKKVNPFQTVTQPKEKETILPPSFTQSIVEKMETNFTPQLLKNYIESK